DAAGDALLAKVQDELYVLAFSSASRATRARAAFATDGAPFLIVAANVRDVLDRTRAADARGFIVDYDVELARFASAHPLPSVAHSPTAAAR
ncbi:MAG TPA: hypothetical protein VHB97_17015, partial [Polyangia bacterium]|nr:hypothetical protein [Polyangia bacterium]